MLLELDDINIYYVVSLSTLHGRLASQPLPLNAYNIILVGRNVLFITKVVLHPTMCPLGKQYMYWLEVALITCLSLGYNYTKSVDGGSDKRQSMIHRVLMVSIADNNCYSCFHQYLSRLCVCATVTNVHESLTTIKD